MTEDEFWELIERIDRKALGEGYEHEAILPLGGALAALEKPELQSFEEHLAQALFDLDGRKYADESGRSGSSDDGFLYARCFVVAMGRDVYQQTLTNPGLMPKALDEWCEPLLYVAGNAWAKRTGEEEVYFDTAVNYETGSNTALW
jgi:hypothetical protein